MNIDRQNLKGFAVGFLFIGLMLSLYGGSKTFKTSCGTFEKSRIMIKYLNGNDKPASFFICFDAKPEERSYKYPERKVIKFYDLSTEDRNLFMPRDIGIYRKGKYTILRMAQIDGISDTHLYIYSFDNNDNYFKNNSRRLIIPFNDVDKNILKELGLFDFPYRPSIK